MRHLSLLVLVLLASCSGVPEGLQPVDNFELARYLGRWHEVARLDHSFERGLTNVTADYRLLADGRVEVINRGFDPEEAAWRDATGVARILSPAAAQPARDGGSNQPDDRSPSPSPA